MTRQRRALTALVGLVALSFVLAACGGASDDSSSGAPAPAPQPAESDASTEEASPATEAPGAPAPAGEPEAPEAEPDAPASEPDAAPAPAEPEGLGGTDESVVPDPLSFTLAAGWRAAFVDEGIKPDVALSSDGSPGITYLREAFDGWIRFAAAAEEWAPQTVADGYFYGPIGLAYDSEDRPNVAWHDHQGATVELNQGDLTHAVRDESAWLVEAAADPGHDGWDSTIAIAEDGVVRAAGVEPSQFGFDNGVEYYELRDGVWAVEPVGTGPIAYEFNVSLAVSPSGSPAISYFDDVVGDLMYASFDGTEWSIESVATDGRTGMFSSLAFDAAGRPHISFFETTGATEGLVRYAMRGDDGAWIVEEITQLADVELGPTGARRNSAIAIAADGTPHVVLSDRSALSYAVRSDNGWVVDVVAEAGAGPLGQLVSFQLAVDGTPHLTFFEVTSSSPLEGLVAYVTRG